MYKSTFVSLNFLFSSHLKKGNLLLCTEIYLFLKLNNFFIITKWSCMNKLNYGILYLFFIHCHIDEYKCDTKDVMFIWMCTAL